MADYDLRSLDLPKLSGRALRLFADAVSSPATRGAFLPALLKQAGFAAPRALHPEEAPTFYPLVRAASPAQRPLAPAEDEAFLGAPLSGSPFSTVRDYAQAYRDGMTTPEEVAGKLLAAIVESDAADPPLHAFIANDREDVLARMRAATARIRAGRPLSLLDGVPVAVKDEVDQAPYPTTAGTTFLGQQPAAEYATSVAGLRAAGALLIGKANMHEIGIDPSGANVHYGATRNPYDPSRDTGGSSSGPSAAVAAGLCPVATELMRYAFPSNLAGLPAITFPVGYDEHELPVGMQAMGRHWDEALLLRLAYVVEQSVARRRPRMFYPILA